MPRALLLSLLLAALVAPATQAKLRVVSTTETMGALAKEVGGDRVDVLSLTRGTQDPHRLEPRPELLVELARADALVSVGLELEIGWLPRLIEGANNPAIRPGAPGNIDTSSFVVIKEKPTGPVDRSQGDVHPLGNPHHWLDPVNAARIAKGLAARLAALDPEGKATYEAGFKAFAGRLKARIPVWEAAAAPMKGKPVVGYHRSWTYLFEWLGLVPMGYVEPKPGVPPSPSHIAGLINEMKNRGCTLVLVEPYFEGSTVREVASGAGARLAAVPQSVGGAPGATGYIELMDVVIGIVAGTR